MSELYNKTQGENHHVHATIVSVKGKGNEQSGRYQVQLHVSQDSGTTNPKDTIEVGYLSQDAPFNGFGHTGARYKIGQTVLLQATGQQGYIIAGGVPNAVSEEGKNDHTLTASHPKGLASLLHRASAKVGSLPKAYSKDLKGLLKQAETFQAMSVEDAVRFRSELESAARKATRGGTDPIKDLEGRVRRVLRDGKEMGRYAAVAKNVNKSIGSFSFDKADMKNPTKYMQKLLGKKAELIPNAFAMMEKLKQAAKNGIPIDAIKAVGGAQLIQQALAGAAQMRSEQSGKEIDLDEYLCILYKELFSNLECTDENGKHTPEYLVWKKAYLLALKLTRLEDIVEEIVEDIEEARNT